MQDIILGYLSDIFVRRSESLLLKVVHDRSRGGLI